MEPRSAVRSFAFLAASAVSLLLLGGCATSPGSGGGASSGGYKDVTVQVNAEHDLDHGPINRRAEVVDLPAEAISSTTAGGVTAVTLCLNPYEDPAGSKPPGYTYYRANPSLNEIQIRSKKLAGVPLQKIKFRVAVVTIGPDKGKVKHLEIPSAVLRLQPTGASRATVISEDIGKGEYALQQVSMEAARFKASKANIKTWSEMTYAEGYPAGQRWDAARSMWVGNPYLYLGDGGGSLYLSGGDWTLESHGAGPGDSDLSYLEEKSKRGEFD